MPTFNNRHCNETRYTYTGESLIMLAIKKNFNLLFTCSYLWDTIYFSKTNDGTGWMSTNPLKINTEAQFAKILKHKKKVSF